MKPTMVNTARGAVFSRANVMKAVMLRDLRSRFFNHGLGFLVVPLWPLAHMLLLISMYTFFGRRAPYGQGLTIFIATGLIPTLTFMYVSRFMAQSILQNKSMMAFPVVKPADVMLARAALEIVGGFLMIFLVWIYLISFGENPVPVNVLSAVAAYLTTLLLAVGVGSVISVLVMINPMFMTVYALSLVIVYISSGTLFVASNLPGPVINYLSYNPVLQCVEWMRSAYFPTYPTQVLDKGYAVWFGAYALLFGLALERFARRKIFE